MPTKETNAAPLCVLGAGSWATALAIAAAHQQQAVYLWARDPLAATQIANEGENTRYLPGCRLPDSVHVTADLTMALQAANDILIVVPSHNFRSLLKQIVPLLKSHHRVCWATKGVDPDTCDLLHTVVQQELTPTPSMAVLSGPSFAKEVARGLPTAVTIASEDDQFANDLIKRFHSQCFRVYRNRDVIGVEIGGAVKNVLAIATGISDGLGFGANARAALITRGLQEMIRLGVALGGERDTLMGLAGMGDLVLTCTDDQSRNRRFGLAIGKGQTSQAAERDIGQVVEGVRNAHDIYHLAKQHHVEMPIVTEVYAILCQNKSPKEVVSALMSREPTEE